MEIDVTYKITASFTMREWSLVLTAIDELQQTPHPMHTEAAELWDAMVNHGPNALPLYQCQKPNCQFKVYLGEVDEAVGQTEVILAHHRSVHGEEDA